ncbi:MAG TPA: Sec-independent protein translocase subunit TatA [Jatrophihabitans sp.]|jgi:sec-independent protein translocase protein TatA|uniref:Sec-independent protein translocase subunit TatA n=1 Tax=Jatrophihabitans sp. TaxID=1932789 RepID=UPI002EF6C33F
MGWQSPSHWVIIALVVLVLFGYKKLPEMSRSVGRSLRIFKTEIKGMDADDAARNSAEAPPATTSGTTTSSAVQPPAVNANGQPAATGEPVVAHPVVPPQAITPSAPVALPPAEEESPQQRTQA